MASEAFVANPIGVEVDPEKLLARLRGGAGEDSLLAMPDGPPSGIPEAHGMT